jgi:hypothetical protein
MASPDDSDIIDLLHVDTYGRKLYLRLYKDGKKMSVAPRREALRQEDMHGVWSYAWSGRMGGSFALEFHWNNDDSKKKSHMLTQVDDQNLYICVAPDAEWTTFAIQLS